MFSAFHRDFEIWSWRGLCHLKLVVSVNLFANKPMQDPNVKCLKWSNQQGPYFCIWHAFSISQPLAEHKPESGCGWMWTLINWSGCLGIGEQTLLLLTFQDQESFGQKPTTYWTSGMKAVQCIKCEYETMNSAHTDSIKQPPFFIKQAHKPLPAKQKDSSGLGLACCLGLSTNPLSEWNRPLVCVELLAFHRVC